jgi:hypothetical protein
MRECIIEQKRKKVAHKERAVGCFHSGAAED